MPKWSDVIARLMPGRRVRPDETERLCAEAAAVTAEQEALMPVIDAQTRYLVRKGEINGFTRQLEAGFARRLAGE